MTNHTLPIISEKTFERLQSAGLVVDGRRGGLLLGPSILEGGIACLSKCEGGYVVERQVEGQMFLVNTKATVRFYELLNGLNNMDLDSKRKDMPLMTTECKPEILNCHVYFPDRQTIDHPKVLLLEHDQPNFFVNRYSAGRHLELLDWMNREEPLEPRKPLSWWRRWFYKA